jgi:hypothetical protein
MAFNAGHRFSYLKHNIRAIDSTNYFPALASTFLYVNVPLRFYCAFHFCQQMNKSLYKIDLYLLILQKNSADSIVSGIPTESKMKIKLVPCSFLAITFLGFAFLFCESPQDPRVNPGNAKITAFKTSFNGDTVYASIGWPWTVYRCTLDIQLPELADNLIVKRKAAGTIVLDTTLTAADTQYSFLFTSFAYGRDTLIAYIIRKQNGGNDTMVKPYISPSLHIKVQSVCGLNNICDSTSIGFDTIWLDTCAFDQDSANDTMNTASRLNWPMWEDTVRGREFCLVKIYEQQCTTMPHYCGPVWIRRWKVIFTPLPPTYNHACDAITTDTLYWTVANTRGDRVTQALILNRSPTCP